VDLKGGLEGGGGKQFKNNSERSVSNTEPDEQRNQDNLTENDATKESVPRK
jgi:hypothetical protein